MLRKLILAVVAVPVVLAVAVHVGVDTPVQPQVWTPPKSPDTKSGPYAPNDVLAVAKRFGYDNLKQPESSAVGPDGRVYTGLNNGQVVRFSPKLLAEAGQPGRTSVELVANTGGRPLGMVFHPDGRLVIADGRKGLVALSVKEGPKATPTVLSTQSEDGPFGFVDDVAVSADGRMAYFSDASSKFAYPDFTSDILEHSANGRLLAYDFQTGQTRTLLNKLYFANGVALAKDESFVLVNETSAFRITRLWLKGPLAGQSEVFVDNLPGFPDNIRTDAQGNFWVAIPAKRDPLLEWLADKPAVRTWLAKLTKFVQFPVKSTAMVLVLKPNGQLLHNLQAPTADGYFYITQATPAGNQVYFNSVHNDGMAVFEIPAQGLPVVQ